MTPTELADALGRTEQTITGYIRRGMPCETVEQAREWILANIRNNGPPTIGERAAGITSRTIDRKDLDEEEQRAKIAKTWEEERAKRLKNDQLEGRLYDADDVELNVAELTGMIRGELESWPDHLQNEWPAELRGLATELLKHKVELLLRRMSQWRMGNA